LPRSFTYSGLTLRVAASGESNREAWFLTAEEGVIRATVFGGPKSRLRGQVAPFHEGKLWIYHDPVRDSRKVSDFDVQFYRTGIRELYERVMAANAVAETILASHGGGGNWPIAAKLSGGVLDALEIADAAACSRLAIYFLWRWAGILGARQELACSSCACEVKRDGLLWYSVKREALLCENCVRPNTDPLIRLGPGARLWLGGVETLPAAAFVRVTADAASLEQAGNLSRAVMAAALGKRLPTWDGI
jgi:DNA repair protein RecO (recombination protein O)